MIPKPGELPVHQSPFYPRAMGRGFGYISMPEVELAGCMIYVGKV
ncbi:hypothetical protein [Pelosinus propionicus]|uniref:Uncharacterized protein n=1 Tax=Pelosinus propionicus DSM 13327 TaxID=1123291 RepID=A0A1I4IGZ8_9FIRM|nr:hypothetical protein [Pelosinus propionicus]SFL53081.1 hypothetical protein SAMN04490355_10088 [Pelosinus propionicus DSM 13327]